MTNNNDNAMQSLARLDNLEVRLYRVTTKSHLRIGAGEGSLEISATENPIIRALVLEAEDENRLPYLPASSLHGVIRSWVEKALRSKESPLTQKEMEDLIAEGHQVMKDRGKDELKRTLGLEEAAEVSDEDLYRYWVVYPSVCDPLLDVDKCERLVDRPDKAAWLQAVGRTTPCAVCRIFGYMGQRGRVRLSHAFPAKREGELPIDIITRVAINRLTGAADEGKLFDLEAIPPGADFYFFATLENMNQQQKQHFQMGINALNLQLAALGAHSTVGFGMVEVTPIFAAEVKPGVFDLEVEKILDQIVGDKEYQLPAERPLAERAPAGSQELEGGKEYQLPADLPLDERRYPRFFVALSSVKADTKQRPTDKFEGHIGYL